MFRILLAFILLTLPLAACDTEKSLAQLQKQCEQDFANWQEDQDIPQSCYKHLKHLKKVAGFGDNDDYLEYISEINSDSRYAIHFIIEKRLRDICTAQDIPGTRYIDEVELTALLSTPRCLRSSKYRSLIIPERPENYRTKPIPPSTEQ